MPFTKYEPYKTGWSHHRCRHPEHDPPGMIVLRPGIHTYKCPGCGATQTISVPEPPTLGSHTSILNQERIALNILRDMATD